MLACPEIKVTDFNDITAHEKGVEPPDTEIILWEEIDPMSNVTRVRKSG